MISSWSNRINICKLRQCLYLLKMVGVVSRPKPGVLLTQLHKTNIFYPRPHMEFRLPTNPTCDIRVFLGKLCAISDASHDSYHGDTRPHQTSQAQRTSAHWHLTVRCSKQCLQARFLPSYTIYVTQNWSGGHSGTVKEITCISLTLVRPRMHHHDPFFLINKCVFWILKLKTLYTY